MCNCFASPSGLVPEQACQIQKTRKASAEGNGANGYSDMQRHHAQHVPNSEQGLPTLRAPQYYQHHE
jgi:hypothetical protein